MFPSACALPKKSDEKQVEEIKLGGAAAEPEGAPDPIVARLEASPFGVYVDRLSDTIYLIANRSHNVYDSVVDPFVEAAYRIRYNSDDEPDVPYKAFPLRTTATNVLIDGMDVLMRNRWLANGDRDYILRVIDRDGAEKVGDVHSLYVRLKCMQMADVKFGTRLAGRLIPLKLNVHKIQTRGGTLVFLSGDCMICDRQYNWYAEAAVDFFLEDGLHSREFTTDEALEKLGLVLLADEAKDELDRRLARARAFNLTPGKVLDVRGPVLAVHRTLFGQRLSPMAFGSPDSPIACVTENELGAAHAPDRFREISVQVVCAPYVRLFDFKRREYVYADVDDLAPYAFDAAALDKLEVDSDYREMLRGLFASEERPAGLEDLIRGKNGGVIILASGPPGTGKTMTAECIGEITQRPIYSIGLGDLGTDLDEVSSNLDAVIAQAERWNALLLIDEADVLLKKRGDDLTRSAIVGLFLHRIEYFRGYLFLTSNLPDELDPAVLSRVTIHRRYPAHTAETRARVWRRLLDHAGLVVADEAVAALSVRRIDGRNIRSVVKLARMLNPAGSELSLGDLERVLAFSAAESAA